MNNKKILNDDFLYESTKKEKSIVDLLNLALIDKKLLLFVTGIGILFSIIFSRIPQRIWEGKFEMLVPLNNFEFSLDFKTPENLIVKNSYKNLENDIQLLKSSLVLRPVFDGIQEKVNKNIMESNQEFMIWAKNIRIEKQARVLRVFYKDAKQDKVLPILKSISNQHKSYFENKKNKSLEKITYYLNQQILQYNEKVNQSLNRVLDFADKNNLNGITIQLLQKKEEAQKFITITGDSLQLKGKKITRDVFFEYRDLLETYFKNKTILNDLEKQKRILEFDNSLMSERSIEIITEPVLVSSSITPSRNVTLLFGSMLSLLIGILLSIYKNRNKSNLISDLSEIKSILNMPLIEEIDLKDNESSLESLKLFAEFNLSPNDLLGIIPVGNIKQKNINNFFDQLKSCHQNTEIISPNNLLKAKNFSFQILIISKNTSNEIDLKKLKYKLSYFNEKVLGWILLEDNI